METQKPKTRFRSLIIALRVILALIAAPVVLYIFASVWINHKRIPPERVAPPQELIGRETPVPQSVARRQASPSPLTGAAWSYRSYLESSLQRGEPGQAGARYYLDVEKQFKSLGLEALYNVPGWGTTRLNASKGYDTTEWKPGDPLDPTQVAWLRTHADFVDLCLRLAESEGLPNLRREELPKPSDISDKWLPNYQMLRNCLCILEAEGQRRAEAGDRAGAERIAEAICKHVWSFRNQEIVRFYGTFFMGGTFLSFLEWLLVHDVLSGKTLVQMGEDLTIAQRDLFPRGELVESWRRSFLQHRNNLIDELNGRWDSYYFMKRKWSDRYFQTDYYYPGLPRVDRIALCMLVTMNRAATMKNQAPRTLGELDWFFVQNLERLKLGYPDYQALPPIKIPADNPLVEGELQALPDTLRRNIISNTVIKTRLNLIRAAVAWRLNPQAILPGADADMSKQPDHPWRDFFTERPLKVVQTTSQTLIYSLGPDLKDQGGRDVYNYKSLPGYAPGDLVIGLNH